MNPTQSFDPVRVLGCTPQQALTLLHGRRVTPGEVEAIATRYYPWRQHVHDPDSYWITASQAAEILGISPQRVKHLLDQKRLPHVAHATGVRLMRRSQIQAIADHGIFSGPPTAGDLSGQRLSTN